MFKLLNRLIIIFAIAGWTNSATATPITDTIWVNGSEWAQADLFTGLTWNQMNDACPGGECNGQLNGHDMTGWLWAKNEVVIDLFNHYIGSPVLSNSNGKYQSSSTTTGEAFFADGWRPIANTELSGFMAFTTIGRKSDNEGLAVIGYSRIFNMSEADLYQREKYFSSVGGWFIRAPEAAIPSPSTLVLFSLAFAILGYNYRRSIIEH
ncbi:Uncharacterised protein [Halioglobus japonicus]|nr:Uncharacterised protein [Halioglobus japonicus]